MPSISARLAKLSAAAVGVSTKTFHNLRSDFLAAVKASGLHSARRSARVPLSPEWQALLQELSTRRAHLGLSRFARYASERGIEPSGVDDSTIEAFIATVRAETLHRKPNDLHRKVAQIWNEAAERSTLALQPSRFLPSNAPRNARTGRRSAIPSRPMPSAISRGVPGQTCSQPMPGGAPWRRERFSCVVTRSMRP